MIYYSILYPPNLPVATPAFELGAPTDTWRFYLEPSVGNNVTQFKGGFIQVRNSETGRNALYPGEGGYGSTYIPFRNPMAEKIVIENESLNILQPNGYNDTIPELREDENGLFYVELRNEVFTLSGSKTNIRYSLQVMFVNDWLSSTLSYGKGTVQVYNEDTLKYENIDSENYFGGNLVEKSISEWSAVTKISPVDFADYSLMVDSNIIQSSIYEFLGSYKLEKGQDPNNNPNSLDSYKIDIYKADGDKNGAFVDSSDWITRKDNTALKIRWQNKIELENNSTYLIYLTIQTKWELRKTIKYTIKTRFGESLFRGKVRVVNDHDRARSKIIMNTRTPLTWGPKENFSVSETRPDFAFLDGDAHVEQGIDLFAKKGELSGEMLISGVEPVRGIEEMSNKWLFRLEGPNLSPHNKTREVYSIYAHSSPIGKYREVEGVPFEEDLLINPTIENGNGISFNTYLETSNGTDIGNVVTSKTDTPAIRDFIYLEDELGGLWETRVTIDGNFSTVYSHQKDRFQFLLPVYFYDSIGKVLAKPMVQSDTGLIYLGETFSDYNIGENTAPQWVNEFRFVKEIYGLEIGRETLLAKQTYKSFLTNYNRKLSEYMPIGKNNQYYLYFLVKNGQLMLMTRDITSSLMGRKDSIDRYSTSAMTGGGNLNTNMFLISDGLNEYFQTVKKEDDEDSKPYGISIDEKGKLTANQAFISTSSTTSYKLTNLKEKRGV